MRPTHLRLLASTLVLPLFSAPLSAQEPPSQSLTKARQPNKVLTLEDYKHWNRIISTGISPDGKWLSYAYDPNEGDATLHFKEIDGKTLHKVKGGTRPAFSEDSRWAAYMIEPPEKEAEKLRKKKEPVVRACELLELGTGKKRKFKGAASFTLAKSSTHLGILKTRKDRKAKHKGADLLLIELGEDGAVYNIGNVSEFAFNEAGTLLAYVVDADGKAGNGIYLRDLASGRVTALDSAEERYTKAVWNKKADDVAVLRGDEVKGFEERDNSLLAFFDLDKADIRRLHFQPDKDSQFPEGFVLSEHARPRWSEDRKRLFVGIKEQREKVDKKDDDDKEKSKDKTAEATAKKPGKKKPAGKKTEEEKKKDKKRSNVEVWHWKDERLQSVQKVREQQDRRSTYLSVVHCDKKPRFVRLADKAMRRVTTSDSPRWAIGRDDSEYRGDMSVARGRADYYRLDLETGQRKLLAQSVRRSLGTSPKGDWLLYSKDGEVFVQSMAEDQPVSLSKRAGVDFTNHQADRPSEKPSYGLVGWSRDGNAVLLAHRYDLWRVPLATGGNGEGKATNLTAGIGSAQKIRFRYVQLDPEEKSIDTDKPLLLLAYGDRSKKSGYYSLEAGQAPKPLIFTDKMIGSVRKAKKAERVFFTQQTIVEFPDLWVADLSFGGPTKVTDANPQQAEYAWTPGRVLIDYVDKRGNELQATLTLPAGYQKGKRYPTLVYFYEKMSQRHHRYSMPRYDDRPHMSTYASDGYVVLMPDIVYEPGKPGTCALDDVGSAVRKAIQLGYVDAEHIGLQGHSWGGYQSSFIVTQTDMFACVVTGAPLTNMFSMHNVLYKRTGNANTGLIQWGQGRMATNPWEDFQSYVEQSPVHHAAKIKTPFMILHGTEDGAVDWNQGLEFFVAAKRLGKEVILLSYPGEPHHLRKRENQKDFQRRMKQYFDHHLKGTPAPKWMTEGLRYLDRDREKRKE